MPAFPAGPKSALRPAQRILSMIAASTETAVRGVNMRSTRIVALAAAGALLLGACGGGSDKDKASSAPNRPPPARPRRPRRARRRRSRPPRPPPANRRLRRRLRRPAPTASTPAGGGASASAKGTSGGSKTAAEAGKAGSCRQPVLPGGQVGGGGRLRRILHPLHPDARSRPQGGQRRGDRPGRDRRRGQVRRDHDVRLARPRRAGLGTDHPRAACPVQDRERQRRHLRPEAHVHRLRRRPWRPRPDPCLLQEAGRAGQDLRLQRRLQPQRGPVPGRPQAGPDPGLLALQPLRRGVVEPVLVPHPHGHAPGGGGHGHLGRQHQEAEDLRRAVPEHPRLAGCLRQRREADEQGRRQAGLQADLPVGYAGHVG